MERSEEEEETPVSFNIDINSTIASKLKSSISRKLFHFLDDFDHDILAEYITVLVCNGKDRIQAKDDLEAFLGKRSGEFVCWLWDQLFRYAHDADIDLKSNRSHVVHAHRSAHASQSLTKKCKTSRDAPKDTELSEYIENSNKNLGTYKEHLQKDRSVSRKEVDVAENHGGHRRAKSFERADIHTLNENEKAGQVSDFPRKLKGLESSNAKKEEGPQGRESNAANISTRSPSTTIPDVPCQKKMSRGCVWDRLGKPCEENSVFNDKSSEAHAGDIVTKHCQAQDKPIDKKYKQKASTVAKPCSEINIRQKRTYSEINYNPSSLPASVDQNCVDDHLKEGSHGSKKLNSSTEAVAPVMLSKMKDVRQKLQEIETEMSKLRSKQLSMSKEGQPLVLLSSGESEHSVGDANSRTVFASNVHFAVTKEGLSSHFAKCGLVSGVTFTDNVKGSAYITFASKDSVEKALALNGTSFLSRPLKVVRKGEKTTLTTSKPPLGAVKLSTHSQDPVPKHGKTSSEESFNLPRAHRHLQWRRDPTSAPYEPSQA